ncbi:MAG: hypothetical protein JSV78_06230 [Phycisphaerales bacterium]|nr:MAG: hypothetical protein JSV78_06230 [Phycisphaerales bacterium]
MHRVSFTDRDGLTGAQFAVVLNLKNDGQGFASNVYANMRVHAPEGASEITIVPKNPQVWNDHGTLGVFYHLVSKKDFMLAPGATMEVMEFHFWIAPPFRSGLSAETTFGCEGAPSTLIKSEATERELADAFRRLQAGGGAENIIPRLLKIVDPGEPSER